MPPQVSWVYLVLDAVPERPSEPAPGPTWGPGCSNSAPIREAGESAAGSAGPGGGALRALVATAVCFRFNLNLVTVVGKGAPPPPRPAPPLRFLLGSGTGAALGRGAAASPAAAAAAAAMVRAPRAGWAGPGAEDEQRGCDT